MNVIINFKKNNFVNYHSILVLFLAATLFLVSCKQEEDAEPVQTNYLLGFEKVNNYSATFIRILLSAMNNEYPGVDTLIDEVIYGVNLYAITYKTSFNDSSIVASGLVCVPVSSGDFPVLSFQNGTNTYRLNAPTMNPADPFFTLIEMMASRGYIVVISDYLGFGASDNMLHPYYDKESTTTAVSDMILASHELLNDKSVKAKSNGKHFLMGYSQGGWATLSELKKTEESYQGKIDVVAASCGAGAYDIASMSESILNQELYPGPLYLPYFIYSKITAGTLLQPLSDYFKEPFASAIPELFSGNHTNSEVNEGLTDTISSLVTDSLRLNINTSALFASLRSAMSVNSVQAWNAKSKLRFYHGTDDANVPPEQSETIYNQFLAAGVNSEKVMLIPIPGASHSSGLIPWGISTIQWFDSLK